MVKFMHMADLHLGFRQYNKVERFIDFNKAFYHAMKTAVREAVDFILICGDVFHDAKVTAEAMFAIHEILARFKQSCQESLGRDIPIYAIEGNHDMSGYYSVKSWLYFLSSIGAITVLSGYTAGEQFVFKPWKDGEPRPGMIEVAGARVYGVPYLGALTREYLPRIASAITKDDDAFTILAMHFGITKEVENKQGIDFGETALESVHPRIDYLALGHFHKAFQLPTSQPWVFNPGSLEAVDVTEVARYGAVSGERDFPRGFYIIETRGKEFTWKLVRAWNGKPDDMDRFYPNRRFVAPQVMILVGNARRSFDETLQFVLTRLATESMTRQDPDRVPDLQDVLVPVVNVMLAGTVEYPSMELDLKRIQEEIVARYETLDTKVVTGKIPSTLDDISYTPRDGADSISDIERDVFRDLLSANPHLEPVVDQALDMVLELQRDTGAPSFDPTWARDKLATWWYTFVKPDENRRERYLARLTSHVAPEKPVEMEPDEEVSSKPARKGKAASIAPSLLEYFDEDGGDLS